MKPGAGDLLIVLHAYDRQEMLDSPDHTESFAKYKAFFERRLAEDALVRNGSKFVGLERADPAMPFKELIAEQLVDLCADYLCIYPQVVENEVTPTTHYLIEQADCSVIVCNR